MEGTARTPGLKGQWESGVHGGDGRAGGGAGARESDLLTGFGTWGQGRREAAESHQKKGLLTHE